MTTKFGAKDGMVERVIGEHWEVPQRPISPINLERMVEQGAKDAADLEEVGDSGGFFYLTPILKMALL